MQIFFLKELTVAHTDSQLQPPIGIVYRRLKEIAKKKNRKKVILLGDFAYFFFISARFP